MNDRRGLTNAEQTIDDRVSLAADTGAGTATVLPEETVIPLNKRASQRRSAAVVAPLGLATALPPPGGATEIASATPGDEGLGHAAHTQIVHAAHHSSGLTDAGLAHSAHAQPLHVGHTAAIPGDGGAAHAAHTEIFHVAHNPVAPGDGGAAHVAHSFGTPGDQGIFHAASAPGDAAHATITNSPSNLFASNANVADGPRIQPDAAASLNRPSLDTLFPPPPKPAFRRSRKSRLITRAVCGVVSVMMALFIARMVFFAQATEDAPIAATQVTAPAALPVPTVAAPTAIPVPTAPVSANQPKDAIATTTAAPAIAGEQPAPTATPTQPPAPTAIPTLPPKPTQPPPPPTAAPTQAPKPTVAPTQAPKPTTAPTQPPKPTTAPTQPKPTTPRPTQPPPSQPPPQQPPPVIG